jgi:hypothetical protein
VPPSLLVVALLASVLAAACAAGGGSAAPASSDRQNAGPTPAGTAGPSGGASNQPTPISTPPTVDPLVGTWTQDYACAQQFTTFEEYFFRQSPAQLSALSALAHMDSGSSATQLYPAFAIDTSWYRGAKAPLTAEDQCKGAADREQTLTFKDGSFTRAITSGADLGTFTYQLPDGSTASLGGAGADMHGVVTVRYAIDGDSLTFEQVAVDGVPGTLDPWLGRQLELKPWHRSG